MKTNLLKSVLVLFTLTLYLFPAFGQSPEKMSYQVVIRNSSKTLVTNIQVGMQISILQGSESGTAVYVETHTPTTNAIGLVSLEIGNGTIVSGDFTTIDWANGPYFIKTETDPTGGTSYTITGTSQLLSAPYALHAKTAGISESDPSVPTGTQTGEMQYWNGSEWITVAAGNEGQRLSFVGGVPTWVTTVGPTNVYNPTTGAIWMDRNLGASQVATYVVNVNAYGDLYQWGRGTDGHEKRTAGITDVLADSDTPEHANYIINNSDTYDWRSTQNDDLWQGVNGINNPCPSGYRLPTKVEWDAERTSWIRNNSQGAFASPLKLPLAGYRNYSDGSIDGEGTAGRYWSSTGSSSAVDGILSEVLCFNSSYDNAKLGTDRRARGFSVRCIKD